MCVCVYKGELLILSHKEKNKILPFEAMWMYLENIMLSELVRQRQTLCDVTYVWNLRNNTEECMWQNKNRLTDTDKKLVVTTWKREQQDKGVRLRDTKYMYEIDKQE